MLFDVITAVGLLATKKKRKRTSKIIKEVFVTEYIKVDGMHRNLIPPPGVVGSRGLVITKPESRIFYYNGNYDLRISPEAEEMIKKLQLTIEARNDVEQAKKIVKDNLDDGEGSEDQLSAKNQLVIKGLVNGKASASNLRDIQVKYIVKEVQDYLKTYSSAEMDIRWNNTARWKRKEEIKFFLLTQNVTVDL
ncbi:hypothetical protein Tco_1096170 [Tanacetum coccineum]